MRCFYTPLDIAIYIKTENLTIKEEHSVIDSLWEKRKDLLEDNYYKEKKIFLNSVKHELDRLDGTFDCIDEINLILQEIGSRYRVSASDFEQDVIESYFKVIKLKLLYTTGKEYCRIKLRTLIGCFGYKRRTAALVEYLKMTTDLLGLKTYLRGGERCDIGEVSLDKIIIIRLK